MDRLVEVSRAIRESVPPELAPVFWLVTLCGSAEFLLLVLSVAYWNLASRRETVRSVIGVAFVALSVTLALKYWFALPRPPPAVQRYPVTPDGFGFPSGHAVTATVVYGGVLLVTDRLRDPSIAVPVGAGIVLIGLSRVVLGVHYLGDVLAGFAVGVAVLVATALAVGDDARLAFVASGVVSVVALTVSGLDPDAILAAGGSVGGLIGTLVWGGDEPFVSTRHRVALNAVGLVVVAAVPLAGRVLASLPAVAVLVNVALTGTVLGLPALVARDGVLARIDAGT